MAGEKKFLKVSCLNV
jgi:hypothetical protein